MVWESLIWLSLLVLFANLIFLTMDTPRVLVGMPASCYFQCGPPPAFSLADEEIKLAQLWSLKLMQLQKIRLNYAYELHSGNFEYMGDSGDMLTRRDVMLSKVESEESVHWLNSTT